MLTYAAAAEGADLRTITTPTERFELRCIIAAADQRQRDDVVCRAELDAWTGYRNGHPDGVPLAAAGPKPEPQDPWAFRDMGNGFARSGPGARTSRPNRSSWSFPPGWTDPAARSRPVRRCNACC